MSGLGLRGFRGHFILLCQGWAIPFLG
uniref:Uncharacterized protein n=1 Tax=Anguilla anguilla TaxID=7936 RepID=A0A0E9VMG4_ANGAN